ncbi:MAG: ATP-grasp domain-containing protein [Oceanospirillaceae bacterium]|nr:ATP-grasp domain-containing protein [Oceanospirillaceae bacterium]
MNRIKTPLNTQQGAEPADIFSALNLEIDNTVLNFMQGAAAKTATGSFCAPGVLINQAGYLKTLSDHAYERAVINPVQAKQRLSAKQILQALDPQHICILDAGALYAAEINLHCPRGEVVTFGVIAQNREYQAGVWSPALHQQAAQLAQQLAARSIPVLTLIDTPGADAGEQANAQLQAHVISALISEMMALPVPSLAVIVGCGYSGGAIPLAAANLLFATRGSVFSTIQPEGLASIARKQHLSWQACAKIVGISAPELFAAGLIDGVIDFDPCDAEPDLANLRLALLAALQHIQHNAAQAMQTSQVVTADDNSVYRRLRYLAQIKRLQSPPLHGNSLIPAAPSIYNAASDDVLPVKPVTQQQRFNDWLSAHDALAYYSDLEKAASHYHRAAIHHHSQKYKQAKNQLAIEVVMHLYNYWKADGKDLLAQCLIYLEQPEFIQAQQVQTLSTIQGVINAADLNAELRSACQNMLLFDALYDGIIGSLNIIAAQANNEHVISQQSIAALLNAARQQVLAQQGAHPVFTSMASFESWLRELPRLHNLSVFLRQVESWKTLQHTRLCDALLCLITYLFEHLIPQYFRARKQGASYNGKINPQFIGRKRDFWHRLAMACCDLQIQQLQRENHVHWPSWSTWVKHLQVDFKAQLTGLVSTDPRHFPGFAASIKNALDAGDQACGLVVGIAQHCNGQHFGLAISNTHFQAGAIDMAAGLRMLWLIETCREKGLPLVGIISSGGMQTKEGAASLFSMPVLNEALSQYYLATSIRPLMLGFADCTGGAQASFVTHPFVDTWYISGANIPFAGQVVVPAYLPARVCLANYVQQFSDVSFAGGYKTPLQGLVRNPFNVEFEDALRAIDPHICAGEIDIQDLLAAHLQAEKPASRFYENMLRPKRFAPLHKVLVHARGCTAVKLINDIHAEKLSVVLVQSDPDMHSHVAQLLTGNDELYCLGGSTPDESYLNANSVLRIAHISAADALHPGIGFLSEDPQFAYRCEQQGLNFIGPAHQTIACMGDKAQALNAAIKANIPVVPGSYCILKDVQDARSHAARVGYPLILKAVFGGGGKGIAVIENEAQLASNFKRLTLEAKSAFGRGDLYLEKFISHMRHVEVQILRDAYGCTKILGIRDCSVQRNNQKLIEESASGVLHPLLVAEMQDAATALANAVDYCGAGTVEFIFDLNAQQFYFMEMNTRLQVEHPVTEMVSGIQIVQQQLRIAAGESINDLTVQQQGYAIEARITAERIELHNGQIITHPSPGIISELVWPDIPGIRIISCVAEGNRVESFYDSLIIQVIARAENREAAITTLHIFLSQLQINGINTNIPLLLTVLEDEIFCADQHNTAFLSEMAARLPANSLHSSVCHADHAQWRALIHVPGSPALKVFSPGNGIFYSAASPQDEPFVKKGALVSVTDTLCLFEAMKLYRPFALYELNHPQYELYPAHLQFKIQHINVSDGQCINAGDLLFVLEPVTY